MNRASIVATAAGAGAFAIAVGLYGFAIFPQLTGESLAVIVGKRDDPHLLTAAIWHSTLEACHLSGICAQSWNAGILAALAVWCCVVGWRLRGPLGALFAGAMVVTSPLVLAPFIDPLGAESSLAALFFLVLAADTCEAVVLPLFLRVLLAAAVVFQDPLLFPAAALYGVLAVKQRSTFSVLPLAAAALAMIVRVLLRDPTFHAIAHPVVNPESAPLAIAAFGLIFLLGPAAMYAAKRGLFRGALFRGRAFSGTMALGFLAALGGLFSISGDPGVYLLAGEAAIIFAVLATVRKPLTLMRPVAVACFLLIFVFQLSTALRYRAREFTLVTAQATQTVQRAIARGRPICMVRPNGEPAPFLAKGAFLQLYAPSGVDLRSVSSVGDCLKSRDLKTQLLLVRNGSVTDFGQAGFALSLAAANALAPGRLVTNQPGVVSPPTAVTLPGGHGAFTVALVTPLASVPELIVTAGFEERFKCPTMPESPHLAFAVANPNAGGSPVRFAVDETTPGGDHRLISRDLPKTGPGNADWRFYSLRLSPRCRALTFRASAYTSSGIAAWAAFVAPAVVKT